MGIRILTLFICFTKAFGQAKQSNTDSSVDIDDIEVIVKSVRLTNAGDTAIVELTLQSYLKNPRELKINTFSSGVIGPKGNVMFYDSMDMGKVRLKLVNRQNYLNYFLTRDEAVSYIIRTPNWNKRWGKPKQFRLTLEDRLEEGKFLQVDIPL